MAVSDDLGYIRLDREVRERFAEAVAAFAAGDRRDRRVGRTRAWTRRSTSGTTIACGDNTASEGPLLAGGLVGDDARALIEAGSAA